MVCFICESICAENIHVAWNILIFIGSIKQGCFDIADVKHVVAVLMRCGIKGLWRCFGSVFPLASLPCVNLRFIWFHPLWFHRKGLNTAACFFFSFSFSFLHKCPRSGWVDRALGRGWEMTDTLSRTEWQLEKVVGLRRGPVRRLSYHVDYRPAQLAGSLGETRLTVSPGAVESEGCVLSTAAGASCSLQSMRSVPRSPRR